MRLASPRLIAVPFIALTLTLAACGGNTVTVQEVPGDPVDLTVPGTGDALAPEPTATPTPTATETPEAGAAQATATPEANDGAAAEATPQADAGGAAEAPDGEDSATTDQPPPAGSDAEQFEDFCAENPGAC